jgi:galactose mutarotase-like enzyme
VIRLGNGAIEVHVDPERGGEIRHVGPAGGGNVLFWDPSSSPLRASRSTGYGTSEADWLSEYRGGWQELFPNAGAACTVNGVPLPFHGEASSARWTVHCSGAREAVLSTPARLPFVLERRMSLEADRPVLRIEETIGNESGLSLPYVWGHHPAFDALPGARIDLPGATAHIPADHDPEHNDLRPGAVAPWPRVPGKDGDDVDLREVPDGPRERVAYLVDLAAGWVALRHPPSGRGVALAWDTGAWPHLWCWTEIGGRDFPWYGRSRIVALEPAASWPNDGLAAAIERDRARRLDGNATATAWLTLALFDADERPVTGVTRDGSVHLTR